MDRRYNREIARTEETRRLVFDFKISQIATGEWKNFCQRYAERDLSSVMEWLESFGENRLNGKQLDEDIVRNILRQYVYADEE